ncbi:MULTISPECIES: hypothetical protein [Okeania]|uniref:Uncharacterized protein n=1 Tax=Okeania hirsuta TaxID=1458930 RepID=A0A3N6PCH5_9CYAN|nr:MULTISPECIES: hypothetical protein [Okeania]NET78619.1 hypothetical protein [Okeania sp. SIO1F9]RQH12982.1 hypothetical protein D4Z78_24670 [Okeania hirsuta]RQH42976.1 hypothetical protein D5R40_14160 [Okeania hirsuta]
MSRNIRLFPSYSQRENQTTNHCLLILKMLYEENPKFLSEVLSKLLGEGLSGKVGVKFTQQVRRKQSTPDGEITQEPFSIFIETKRGNNFDEGQLLRHLESLKQKQGAKVLIALANYEQDEPNDPAFSNVKKIAEADKILFLPISFEYFLESIKVEGLSKSLADAIADLEEYFDEENLLPSWKYRLDVVNCAGTYDDVINHNIYVCTAKGGQYSHRRSLYFGVYRNKQVDRVAKIEAVVDIESEDEYSIKWKNVDKSDEELVEIARNRRSYIDNSWYPARVFLLADLHPTNFRKTTPGGMQSSKRYFYIGSVNDVTDLAEKLKDETWEQYQ